MTRLAQARPAVRPSLKARLMLSGPAGSGKTYSGLEIASELGDRILVIDTEKESALTYADEFTFTHLPWHEPFDPRELGRELVAAAADFDVIMIDSMSHFWGGAGGTLDIADGKFGGWKTARPAQNDGLQGILASAAHIIVCCRSKMEYVQELDSRSGKQVVKKLGMAPKQDGEFEYELNLACEISIEHKISVSKSRTTAVPVGMEFHNGHARDLAKAYAAWLGSGEAFADLEQRAQIDKVRRGLSDNQKKDLWQAWQAAGLPASAELLTVSQAVIAQGLLEAVTETKTEQPA